MQASWRPLFLLASSGLLGGQSAILLGVWSGQIGARTFLYCHALLCIAALVPLVALRSSPAVFAAYLQLALWTAIAGPLGTLIAVSATAWAYARVPTTQDFGVWLDRQAVTWEQKTRDLQSALLDRRIRIEGASDARPLREVFIEGSQKEKFAALTVMARRYDPSLAYALQLATKDRDPSVRVLASTVIAKLQTRISMRITALKESAAVSDDAPAAWLAVGEAYADYAASGLLSHSQAHEHLGLAVACLDKARTLSPSSESIKHEHALLSAEYQRSASFESAEAQPTAGETTIDANVSPIASPQSSPEPERHSGHLP